MALDRGRARRAKVARAPGWRGAASGLVLLALASLGTVGCNFFKPARPELPTGSGVVARYTQPDTTLNTLALAIQDKAATNGLSAYSGAFADTASDPRGFDAFFDPATLARYPNPETSWDHDKEVTFYGKFCQQYPNTTFQMRWEPDPNSPDDQVTATSATLHRFYRVNAIPAAADTLLHIAQGYADLQLELMSGNWKIVRWQDREDPTVTDSLRILGEASYGQRRQESRF